MQLNVVLLQLEISELLIIWASKILCLLGRSVFWALFGAIYLCFGMPEVYRVLFEVFGMDPEAEDCQPKLRRQLEDVDYVSVEFEGKKLSWQDVAGYKASSIMFSFLFNFIVVYPYKHSVPSGVFRWSDILRALCKTMRVLNIRLDDYRLITRHLF